MLQNIQHGIPVHVLLTNYLAHDKKKKSFMHDTMVPSFAYTMLSSTHPNNSIHGISLSIISNIFQLLNKQEERNSAMHDILIPSFAYTMVSSANAPKKLAQGIP